MRICPSLVGLIWKHRQVLGKMRVIDQALAILGWFVTGVIVWLPEMCSRDSEWSDFLQFALWIAGWVPGPFTLGNRALAGGCRCGLANVCLYILSLAFFR